MAKLSISKASKEWGVARSTLQRKIKQGELSATGGEKGAKTIDTSELLRVFGEPKDVANDTSEPVARDIMRQVDNDLLDQVRSENKFLKKMIENQNTQIESHIAQNETLYQQIEKLTKELTDWKKPKKRLSWLRGD